MVFDLEKTGDLAHTYSAACIVAAFSFAISASARRYSTGITLRNSGRYLSQLREDFGCALGAGVARVVADQLLQAFGVHGAEIGHHVDAAMGFEIVVVAELSLGDLLLLPGTGSSSTIAMLQRDLKVSSSSST